MSRQCDRRSYYGSAGPLDNALFNLIVDFFFLFQSGCGDEERTSWASFGPSFSCHHPLPSHPHDCHEVRHAAYLLNLFRSVTRNDRPGPHPISLHVFFVCENTEHYFKMNWGWFGSNKTNTLKQSLVFISNLKEDAFKIWWKMGDLEEKARVITFVTRKTLERNNY